MDPRNPWIPVRNGVYSSPDSSPSSLARVFPTLAYYLQFMPHLWRTSRIAAAGRHDNAAWCASSRAVLHILESAGVRLHIEGLDHLYNLTSPCVIAANHMSTLETMVLPVCIQPVRDVTFVVKKELLTVPVFKHIMRSRDPIVVGRSNPRDDLKAVQEGCAERVRKGISVVVFPQNTRSTSFDPDTFNSIAVKMARTAECPIIPLALRSDAWGSGRLVRDFGPIDPSKPVRFTFGPPIDPSHPKHAHSAVIRHIAEHLKVWSVPVSRVPPDSETSD